MNQHVLTCDGCGRQRIIGKELILGEQPWVQVKTLIVSQGEQLKLQETLSYGGEKAVDDLLDTGDFCSLVCLANWSSARATMKSLSDGA